jgi:CheY-like chemotaxis protein
MMQDIDIYRVFADDRVAAVTAFQTFKLDLIFMDISMPKMDGKEVTRAIRDLEKGTPNLVGIVALPPMPCQVTIRKY